MGVICCCDELPEHYDLSQDMLQTDIGKNDIIIEHFSHNCIYFS